MQKNGYKMKKILIIILFTTICLNASEIKDKSENLIKDFIQKEISLSFEKFRLNKNLKREIEKQCKQRFFRDEVYLWEIEGENGLEAIAILDNVKGKNLPITFLAIFDLEGKIIYSTIVKYREEHGGAVQQSWWQKQFWGLNSDSDINIGSTIDVISGATISSNSIAKGMKKLALLFRAIKTRYEN